MNSEVSLVYAVCYFLLVKLAVDNNFMLRGFSPTADDFFMQSDFNLNAALLKNVCAAIGVVDQTIQLDFLNILDIYLFLIFI